jgi:ribosomal protein S27AE
MLLPRYLIENINNMDQESKFYRYNCEKDTKSLNKFSIEKLDNFYSLLNLSEGKKLKQLFSKYNCMNLRGGGKKRKKKTYTKPKKIKHVRKKIKLKVLKYYKIENSKIKKMKKESPNSPGCFMAEHFDRLTCGKTGLTLVRKN